MNNEGRLSQNFLDMEAEITRLRAEVTAANERVAAAVDDYNDALAEVERLRAIINTNPEPDVDDKKPNLSSYEQGYLVGFWDAVARIRDAAKEPKT